ncbi:MAG: GDP-mannose 4,6-dehydratase [Phycisphaeraceae bacterium]|nr:GDP-mannose 4,6-dehydratase [Phycisphaeraceae bacterium]
MAKSLITGGAGFIGSHLAELLKARGDEVILVDSFSTGRRSNIAHLLDNRCRIIESSIGEALTHDPHLLQGVREVYHLAAAVGVRLVVDDPFNMIRNNVEETARILDAARQAGASILITSSSEVYGKAVKIPLNEDDDLILGPTTSSRWSYALSKALDEHLALAHHAKHGVGMVIVRLFNTIGLRQIGRYGMVVPRFVQRAIEGGELEIYGDGQQTRAFCDVRDVVRALTALLGDPRHHGKIFNVGSDREITVSHLAELVIATAQKLGMAKTASKRLIPYAQAYEPGFEDPRRRVPDLTRIRSAIGFKPAFTLEQTLAELVFDAASQTKPSPAATT